MKSKIILFVLVASIVVAIAAGFWLFEQDRPNRIVLRMSNYYGNLTGFEGVNTIVAESAAGKITRQMHFAFLRPNRFFILPNTTNDSQLYCDGTNLYNYQPFNFNSFTKVSTPVRFEDVITNRVGGELLLMITRTNRFDYLMNGFGRGLKALKYEGHERITGIECDRLGFQLVTSNFMEVWVARGAATYAVKFAFSFRSPLPPYEEVQYTETISDWKGNGPLALEEFVFSPPGGAVERPVEDDQVELSGIVTNGTEREVVKFYSSKKVADDARKQAEFLKGSQRYFRDIALKAILEKFKDVAAGDLALKGIEPASEDNTENGFVVTFALPKTMKQKQTGKSIQISEETVFARLATDGRVEHVGRGSSFDFRSK